MVLIVGPKFRGSSMKMRSFLSGGLNSSSKLRRTHIDCWWKCGLICWAVFYSRMVFISGVCDISEYGLISWTVFYSRVVFISGVCDISEYWSYYLNGLLL